MHTPRKLSRTLLPLLALTLALAALGGLAKHLYWQHLYTYSPQLRTALSGKTQVHCIGRYRIDIPIEFGPVHINTAELHYRQGPSPGVVKINIKDGEFDPTTYAEAINARLHTLQTTRDSTHNAPLLLHTEPIQIPPYGPALLVRYLSASMSDANPQTPGATSGHTGNTINTELHLRANNRYVVLNHIAASNSAMPLTTTTTALNPALATVEERLKRIATHLRNDDDAPQASHGFCMNDIVFDEKAMGHDEEQGAISFHNAIMGFALTIHMLGTTGQAKAPLLQRAAPTLAQAPAASNSYLRQLRLEERQHNGMLFQEIAIEQYQKTGKAQYTITAENQPQQATLQQPHIRITLDMGHNTSSFFDAPQTLEIWDKVLNSMRLSPANEGKVASF